MQFSVKDFGAVGDGKTKDTEAIRRAIAACSAAGGGEVSFPNGTYISGTLELLDGVTLFMEKGATLRASGDLADFEKLPLDSCDVGVRIGFIYAIGKRDIGLAGPGIIDFASDAFFRTDERMPFPGQQNPLTPRQQAEATLAIPPRLNQPVCIHDSTNVVFQDIRLVNSPCWTVSMVNCTHVTVDRVTVDNSLLVPNSDGLGFSVSTDVTVSNCHISCADDCLTFCGTKQATVSNCVLRSRSTAIRIGYLEEVTEDLVFSNLVIHDTNRAIIFQGTKNSVIRNVLMQNIVIHTRRYEGAWWGSGEPLTMVSGSENGSIRHVMITNVRAECARGIALRGLPMGNVEDILLRDWRLTITAECEPAGEHWVDFRDEEERRLPDGCMPWLYAENIRGLRLDNMMTDKTGAAADVDITPILVNSAVEER